MSLRKMSFLISFSCASLVVHGQTNDSLQVLKATETFLKAFTSFDWNTFKNTFSSDATIFFPIWEQRKRKAGRKEIDSTWLQIFPEFLDSTKRFDFKIDPKNILIQLYRNTGIVTFHIGGDDYLSRRTMVFVKENTEWKIVHLHASGLGKPD